MKQFRNLVALVLVAVMSLSLVGAAFADEIPAYGEVYTNPHFVVKDTLSDLKLKSNTVTVANMTEGTEYTLSANDNGYTITFKADYLKTVKSATNITITYDAEVTSTALKAINEETNDVSIEYSHNPADENDYDVKKDTTQHYTFSLDAEGLGNYSSVEGLKTSELVKIGVDAAGNPITQKTVTSDITGTESWTGPLAGAVFELYKTSDVTGTGTANDPYVVNANASYFKTATTGDDGRMNFAGLDAGTYYIKEKSAPAGYVTDSTVHKIELIAETDTVTVTEWWNGSAWVSTKPTSGTAKEVSYETEILKSYTVKIDGVTKDTYTFTNGSTANDNEIKWTTIDKGEQPHAFTNTKGVELPSTGGIGTTIFYVAGIVLVLGAAAIIIARRKAEQE